MIKTADQANKKSSERVVILGGGLAGLAAGYKLSEAGIDVSVVEKGTSVGGLSKTFAHGGFLFDLGGHRFLTKEKEIEDFVISLMDGEFLEVPRTSKIYMLNRYFDYPLRPANAIWGLGIFTTAHIIADYCIERIKGMFYKPHMVSLEDWVVSKFGRRMFNIYFKTYSEKVWGLDCSKISMEWVAQRIQGLSLGAAIKNALFKVTGRDVPSLADKFYYPKEGIGRLSERMREVIEEGDNTVEINTEILKINHQNFSVESITAMNGTQQPKVVQGEKFVSSIPMTSFVQMLEPEPPKEVKDAADRLKFRDLIIVTIMLDKEQVTDLTWMYLPGDDIPFGRIHEPKNWSPYMAPEGKTHVVAEFFCFKGNAVWNLSDEELTSLTVEHLVKLDFISESDVIDSCVLKIANAYPIFEVGYETSYQTLVDYLNKFDNIHLVGRSGKFRYLNMDHAIESGLETASAIISQSLH